MLAFRRQQSSRRMSDGSQSTEKETAKSATVREQAGPTMDRAEVVGTWPLAWNMEASIGDSKVAKPAGFFLSHG